MIWRHTQGYPERARAAVQLVSYLTGKAAELRWGREVRSLPARVEALQELYPPESPLHAAFTRASERGRAYPAAPLWRRLEYQIAQELSACLAKRVRTRPGMQTAILHEQLDPLVERLNLTLRG